MLWKVHKVLNKTPLIEYLLDEDIGLHMFWELFAMLFISGCADVLLPFNF